MEAFEPPRGGAEIPRSRCCIARKPIGSCDRLEALRHANPVAEWLDPAVFIATNVETEREAAI
jgi:hypothetical protein